MPEYTTFRSLQMNNGKPNYRNPYAYDDDWFRFPRAFMWGLEMTEAVVLASLRDKERRCDSHVNKLRTSNGWFYYTTEDMFGDTGLLVRTQQRSIKKLVTAGYVLTTRRGVPPKRYFKLNHNLIDGHAKEWIAKKEEEVRKIRRKKAKRIKKRILDREEERRQSY
jgi:hypothetical protein